MNFFRFKRKLRCRILAFYKDNVLHIRQFLYVWFLLSLIFSTPSHANWYEHNSTVFGTRFSIELWHSDSLYAEKLIKDIEVEMWRIHHLMSPYEAESELSQVNQYAHKAPWKISQELTDILSASLFFSKVSQGAFDISFASVGSLYDYNEGKKPSSDDVRRLKEAINYRLIELNQHDRTVKLSHSHMQLDLGGIAKGYAMDRAADMLIREGIKHATISAGGDMRVIGDKRGRPWLVGIRHPRQQQTAVRLPLDNVAVSTSGDYERFFIEDSTGERVHHIINPSTGTSAMGLTSVTVIGDRAFDTDPLSTAVFVLGIERGLALINGIPEFDAVLIDSGGRVHYSDGLIVPSAIEGIHSDKR